MRLLIVVIGTLFVNATIVAKYSKRITSMKPFDLEAAVNGEVELAEHR